MATNDGGNAFPMAFIGPGMTLRDYFAARVLQAMFTNTDYLETVRNLANERNVDVRTALAHNAYELADAMLAAREKEATDHA